jgi:CDP-glucose 4,6-dehydratase
MRAARPQEDRYLAHAILFTRISRPIGTSRARGYQPAAVGDAVADARPEIIFHLAAQPLVRRGYREPLATFAANIMGTAHLLDAARSCSSLRAMVVVTSDKCYGNPGEHAPFVESDPLGGHDPYSASKACTELVAAAWRDSYWRAPGSPLLATARAGNVIGGGDWAEDRLIPDLVRAAASGTAARIRNPAAIRPWQHVLEPLAGYLQLGAALVAGEAKLAEAWNFGPDPSDTLPVSSLCDTLCPALGITWDHERSPQPAEAATLWLDSGKARNRLGWKPRWPLTRALQMTTDWYVRHGAGEDARELCMAQIEAYCSGATR